MSIKVKSGLSTKFNDNVIRYIGSNEKTYTPMHNNSLLEETELFSFRDLINEKPELAESLCQKRINDYIESKLKLMKYSWQEYFQFKFPLDFNIVVDVEKQEVNVQVTKLDSENLAKVIVNPTFPYRKQGWQSHSKFITQILDVANYNVDLKNLSVTGNESDWFEKGLQNSVEIIKQYFQLILKDPETKRKHAMDVLRDHSTGFYDVDLRLYI